MSSCPLFPLGAALLKLPSPFRGSEILQDGNSPFWQGQAVPLAKAQKCTCDPKREVLYRSLDLSPTAPPSKVLQNTIITPGASIAFLLLTLV